MRVFLFYFILLFSNFGWCAEVSVSLYWMFYFYFCDIRCEIIRFFGVFTGSDNWTSDKNKTELALRTHSTKLNVPQQNTVKYDLTTSNLVIWQTAMSQIDETAAPIGRCHGIGECCDESASPFHLFASCVCRRWPIQYILPYRCWSRWCLSGVRAIEKIRNHTETRETHNHTRTHVGYVHFVAHISGGPEKNHGSDSNK